MKKTVFLLLLFFVMSSCRTKYVPVETVRTEYKDRFITNADTFKLVEHDSIYIDRSKDTVLIEKWKVRYLDRIKERVDSVLIEKVDSVQVPYPVEAKLTKWQKAKMNIGSFSIFIYICAAAYVIAWLIKRYRVK
jgi:hypothetical protein